MNDLIKLTEQNGKVAVSARELYSFLDVNTKFSEWCKRMFEYGFEQERDFIPILGKTQAIGRPSIDYALSLDCAKEISMLQRTEKGKQARQYFIEKEKELSAIKSGGVTELSAEEILVRQSQLLLDQKKRIAKVEDEVKLIKAQVTTRPDYFTVAGYSYLLGRRINYSTASILGNRASRYCKENNLEMGLIRDPRWGKVRMYPAEVLEQVFSQAQ